MSGEYFLRVGNLEYQLDSTSQMSYSLSGKTTDSPIESGESVSDHYINNNDVITISGTISDMKSLSTLDNLKTSEYIEKLVNLKRTGNPFTVIIGSRLEEITNCVVTSLVLTQTGENGTFTSGSIVSSSYQVSLSFKRIKLAKAARIEVTAAPPEQKSFQAKETSSQKTEQEEIDPLANLLNRSSLGLF